MRFGCENKGPITRLNLIRVVLFLALGLSSVPAQTSLASAKASTKAPSLIESRVVKPSDAWRRMLALPSSQWAASSPYLPMSLRTSFAGREKLRTWWKDVGRDSTSHVIWHGGKAEMSFDFVRHLAERRGWGKPHSWDASSRASWAENLSRETGLEFSSGMPRHASYLPNDKWLVGSPQWALNNPGVTYGNVSGIKGYDIHMLPVWDQFGGSDSLVIAVVDAGFNFKHPDLKNRWSVNPLEAGGKPGVDDDGNGFVDDSIGWDFVEGDNDPSDGQGHGTEVSSVIAAGFDNGIGIAGILPEARILPVRVLNSSGQGDLADIAAGIQYAVDMGADVINFSIGGSGDSRAMKAAFQYARDKGVPVVVAAGNEAVDLDSHPQVPFSYGFDNVISVAAVNHAGQFCSFSNYGKNTVDLAAPGENILTCGVADRIEVLKDDFESDLGHWTSSGANDFRLTSTSPLEGQQSVEWVAGASATLTLKDTLDLRGKTGGAVWFKVQFTPANLSDALIVEALALGGNQWQTLAALGGSSFDQGYSFGLTHFDDKRFRLRFRTFSSGSTANRRLKLDFVYVSCLNPAPADSEPYPIVAGTSFSAPHVAAYVALLKLASKRMGIPFTKDLVLAGTVPDTACANRTISGGHLDVAKGLAFYLKTLPTLQITDSSKMAWIAGEKVEYDLRVSLPGTDWRFASSPLPEGGQLETASGHLIWQAGIPSPGRVEVALLAQGETTLRRHLQFEVIEAPTPIGISRVTRPGFRRGISGMMTRDPRWILGKRPVESGREGRLITLP